MYCTISKPPSSRSELSEDARRALSELATHARALGALSASFRRESTTVAAAYRRALTDGDPVGWTTFINAAATIAEHGASVQAHLRLDEREQIACRYFSTIAYENSDLIVDDHLAVA